MTHYTRDYSGLTEQEKKSRAIADLKTYLGKKYNYLVNTVGKMPPYAPRRFEFDCNMFLGIEGYPVGVLYDEIWGEGAWDAAWADEEEE